MNDPWADIAAAKWNPETAALHDLAHHKRTPPGAWPTCPRCSMLAVEFHDSHNLGHLVPADARHRYDQEQRI